MTDERLEWQALGMVLSHIGTEYEKTDVRGAADKTPDFAVWGSGPRIALEVTMAATQEVKGFWDAILSQEWFGSTITCGWSISLASAGPGRRGPSIRAIRAEVEQHLRVLEDEGQEQFGRAYGRRGVSQRASAAIAALDSLGVRAGSNCGPPPAGCEPLILTGTSDGGGWIDCNAVVSAVESEAPKNIEKLRAADADTRQLFVWVETSDIVTYSAISAGGLPDRSPNLPSGLDRVWVSPWQRGDTVPSCVLWSYSVADGWKSEPIRYRDLLAEQ